MLISTTIDFGDVPVLVEVDPSLRSQMTSVSLRPALIVQVAELPLE